MRLRSLRPLLPVAALLLAASVLSLVPQARASAVSRIGQLPRIATGQYHTCALTSDGRAYCWGGSAMGNGSPYTMPTATPTAVTMPTGKRFVSIVVGESHSCGLASDGTAWCWGDNTYGQVGSPSLVSAILLPTEVAGGHRFVQLAAGQFHTCGLEADGDAFCWGSNGSGQLGAGVDDTTNRYAPTSVAGGIAFTQLAAGPLASTTCGLEAGGAAWCWGAGIEGQLGNYQMSYSTVPDEVLEGINTPITDLVQVSVGSTHTCALDASGDVWCWGDNSDGQFGNGTSSFEGSLVADLVLDATASDASKTYIQIVVAGGNTCGVSRDGTARCWGYNADGQLGDGTKTSSNVPVTVFGLSGVSQVAVGGLHACAALADGGTSCWGSNAYSALGDGTSTDRTTPVSVSLTKAGQFTQVASGPYAFTTCSLDDLGAAWCWGWNNNGEIGDGTTTYRYVPAAVAMPPGKTFVQLSSGWHHTCALAADGTAWCWGDNAYGQLGDASTTDRLTPTAVSMPPSPSGARFVQISAGADHTCALTVVGSAWCWGWNLWGQLGDGTTTARSMPTPVAGGKTFTEIGSGRLHTCGLAVDGAGWCWGANGSGRLGNGSLATSYVPVAVAGDGDFAHLFVGMDHACGLTPAGAASCWGYNRTGQLGDGTTTDRSVPTQVIGGKVFTGLAAGNDHTCGRSSDGVIWCWGDNSTGQLGDGTKVLRTAPTSVTMPSGATFAGVASGRTHACALAGDGTVWCWGWSTSGQTGLGPAVSSVLVPTPITSVSVSLSGTGVGTVTSSPTGISCPPTCTAPFPREATVTLSAAASGGSSFKGWSGSGCTGMGTCVVTTTQVRSVTALFTQPPTISSFTPTSAGKGAAVTVTGTNFMPGATCKINGVTVPTCAYVDATTIVTSIPSVATSGKITVTTVGGSVVSSGSLTVGGASVAPTISYVAPTSVGVGFDVTIEGSNVGAATSVKVNATSVTAWSVVSAGMIRIKVPTGATSGKVTLTTAGGSVISSATVSVFLPPTITSFTPTSGPDGTEVTITGTNLNGTTYVSFGGAPAASFTVVSSTSIRATVPRGTPSGAGIVVANPAGTAMAPTAYSVERYVATKVAAGGAHSCAVTDLATVRCWGNNASGQLGDGTTSSRTTSVPVSLLNGGVTSVVAGSSFTCALLGTWGEAYCWGDNASRQLGDGTTSMRTAPVRVRYGVDSYLGTITQIAAGNNHACALLQNGTVKCWGLNSSGQLGNGSLSTPTFPTTVVIAPFIPLPNVVQIAAGGSTTCALTSAGAVWCWGSNTFGQVGDNTLVNRPYPVPVTDMGSLVTTLAVGGAHACATKYEPEGENYSYYKTYCWGNNSWGQLGNNSTTFSKTPVLVVTPEGGAAYSMRTLTAGNAFTCGTIGVTDSSVRCWGLNSSGQLGRNSVTNQLVAQFVLAQSGSAFLSGVTAIAAGYAHVVAISGAAGVAWGANASGRLGDGSTANRLVPVYIRGF